MKLFRKFVFSRRRPLILFGVLALLLGISFALYRLPLAAVVYPLSLCAGIALIVFGWDFAQAKKRHERLKAIQNTVSELTDTQPLPRADGISEEDDRELIRLLLAREARAAEEDARRYRAMIDYYTVWAHQVKTPIASMRLTLQNEDSELSRKLQNDLSRIDGYADMVMTYLRLDAGSTDYVIRACDLDSIVRPAVKKFAGEFIAKRLRLEYEPLNCSVLTDEKWLSFVVEQVLSNAVKYTNAGSVSITLEAPKTLCIRDTGIGIAPEDLPRIFENGFTGFNGRADKKASGIGLYLCRRVCGKLGHRIWAESEAGAGTAVRIDLDTRRTCVE